MKTRKPLRIFLISIGLVPVLYGLNFLFTPEIVGPINLELHCRPRGNVHFESALWKNSTTISGKRYEMVDDLIATRRLIGLSESELKNVLGEPNSVGLESGHRMFVYHLARQKDYPAKSIWFPGLFPNHEAWMLKVVFRNGKVQSAEVFFT